MFTRVYNFQLFFEIETLEDISKPVEISFPSADYVEEPLLTEYIKPIKFSF